MNVISSELDLRTLESFRKTCQTSKMPIAKVAPPGTDQIELSFPLHPPDSPAKWGNLFQAVQIDLVPLNIWWFWPCRPHCQQKLKDSNTPNEKKNNWTHHIMLSELEAIVCQKMNELSEPLLYWLQNIHLSHYSLKSSTSVEAIFRHSQGCFWQIHHSSSWWPSCGRTRVFPQ